jgi:hypothetical protein
MDFLCSRKFRTGQATLSFIILIGGVILQVAIAGSVVGYLSTSSRFSERLSARAMAAASAGLRDAQIRISRDRTYGELSDTYSFAVGSDTVEVTVSRVADDSNGVYIYTVSSIGSALARQKRLVGTIFINQANGLLELKSVEEETIN